MEDAASAFAFAKSHLENTPELASLASPDTKLRLYGLYKQATCGDCAAEPPSIFNVMARAKHDAWTAQAGLSKEEASRSYTRTVMELDPSMKIPVNSTPNKQQAIPTYRRNLSLSALSRSESSDFLSRLLGQTPVISPSPSMSSLPKNSSNEDTIFESNSRLEKLRHNASLDELKKTLSTEDASTASSSIFASSTPTTPRGFGVLRNQMSRSSSLGRLSANDSQHAGIVSDHVIHRRRKSEGDEFDIMNDPAGDDDDDDESDMDWDDDDFNVDRKYRGANLYLTSEDEDDIDSYLEDDDDRSYQSADRKIRQSHFDNHGSDDEENESILGTLIFTMPFVLGLKIYQIIASIAFFPITSLASSLGFQIKRTPDNVSIREKKQAATLLLFTSVVPITPIVYMWVFFFLIFPFTTLPTAMYLAWMFFWDESPRDGSRKPLLKDIPLSKYFCEYFPISLSRKSDVLDPSRKYVFAYHPHGIIGLGSFGAFATHAAGFKEKFPGLDMRLLTLDQNFKIPLIRELLLGFGVCSCSRKACNQILQRGPGSAICLVVGGAAESLETQCGTYRLVLGRKGFVQVAVDNDADLVPVIAFGETDAFNTFSAKPGTFLREIQVWIQKKIKFTVPLFWGRGLFNSNFGILPKRRPIHVVTGEPLSIKPFRDRGLEGEALVDAVHHAYIAALRRLFDENKDESEAGIRRKESITIIK